MTLFVNDIEPPRKGAKPKPRRAVPVTHPTLVTSSPNNRYVLGMARTEESALRILRRSPIPQNFTEVRQRSLMINGKSHLVWEPKP